MNRSESTNDLGAALAAKLERVSALRLELRTLEDEVLSLKGVLKDAIKTFGIRKERDSEWLASGRKRRRSFIAGSTVSRALDLLRERKAPLHIDAIVDALNEQGERVSRSTLVSNLSRYIKNEDTFTRTGRNEFGLVEWRTGSVQ